MKKLKRRFIPYDVYKHIPALEAIFGLTFVKMRRHDMCIHPTSTEGRTCYYISIMNVLSESSFVWYGNGNVEGYQAMGRSGEIYAIPDRKFKTDMNLFVHAGIDIHISGVGGSMMPRSFGTIYGYSPYVI